MIRVLVVLVLVLVLVVLASVFVQKFVVVLVAKVQPVVPWPNCFGFVSETRSERMTPEKAAEPKIGWSVTALEIRERAPRHL